MYEETDSELRDGTSLASLSSMDVGIANPLDSIALDGDIGLYALEGEVSNSNLCAR
jgi:hypothetical protein